MASAPPPLEAVRDRLGRGIEMLAGTPDQVHEWNPAAERRFAPDSAMWPCTPTLPCSSVAAGLAAADAAPLALAGVVQH